MKNKITLGLLLVMTAMLCLVITGVNAAQGAAGLVKLNCSYDTSTPTDGVILISGPAYATPGETYTTATRDDLTFTIKAMVNSNNTNTTWNSLGQATLYWNSIAMTPTVTVAKLTNFTGATNATFVVSNYSESTYSYYMRFYVPYNGSYQADGSGGVGGDNITCVGSSAGTCTQYNANDATYPNMTWIDCPTRQVTIKYKNPAISCGDGACVDGEPTSCPQDCPNYAAQTVAAKQSQKKTNTIILITAIVLIAVVVGKKEKWF